MSYKIADNDYLDLWKYFEDRADNVKEAMFNSVTWAIGFAAAVFGFIVTRLVDSNGAEPTLTAGVLTNPRVVMGASSIGILLCAYSVILVFESKKHIIANWKRATDCRAHIEGLDLIGTKRRDVGGIQVWHSMLVVIVLLMSGFVAVLAWAVGS